MRRCLITFMLPLLLLACGTTKKTAHSSEERQASQSIELSESAIESERCSEALDVEEVAEEEILIVVYDTDKPILKATGKPPVKEEYGVKRIFTKKDNSEIVTTLNTETDVAVAANTEEREEGAQQITEIKKEPKAMRCVLWVVVCIVVIVICVLICKFNGRGVLNRLF